MRALQGPVAAVVLATCVSAILICFRMKDRSLDVTVKPWPTSAAAAGGDAVGVSTVAVATASDATMAALRLLPCHRPDLCMLGIAERLMADPSRVKAPGGKVFRPQAGRTRSGFAHRDPLDLENS